MIFISAIELIIISACCVGSDWFMPRGIGVGLGLGCGVGLGVGVGGVVVVVVVDEVVVVDDVVVVGARDVASCAVADLSLTASINVTTGGVTAAKRPHRSRKARLSAFALSPSRPSSVIPPPFGKLEPRRSLDVPVASRIIKVVASYP
jgi:hypothetical protein